MSASNPTYGSTSANILSDYPTWEQQLQNQYQHLRYHRERTHPRQQLRSQYNQGFCLRCNGSIRGSQPFQNCIQWLRTHHHALGYSLLTYNLFTRFINNTIIFLERRNNTLGQIDALRAGIDFLGAISFNQVPEVTKALLVSQLINLCDQTNNFAQLPGSFPLPGPSNQNQNQEDNTDAASESTNITVRESDEEIVRTLNQPLYPPLPSPSGRTVASEATPDISPLIIAEDTARPIRTPQHRPRRTTQSLSPVLIGRRINPNVTVENILFPRTNLGRPITRTAGQNILNPPVRPNQPEQNQGDPSEYENPPNYEPRGELPGYGQHHQDTRIRVPTNNAVGEPPSSDESSSPESSESDNDPDPDQEGEAESSEEEEQQQEDQNQGSPVQRRGPFIFGVFDEDLYNFGGQNSEEEQAGPVLPNRNQRDLETFWNDPNALNNPNPNQNQGPDSDDEEDEEEQQDNNNNNNNMAQNNQNNNNQNQNNIFNDGQFQTWMQMITQAVNNAVNPPVNQRILNIAKVNEYYGTD